MTLPSHKFENELEKELEMARLEFAPPEKLAELEPELTAMKQAMGFVPNSLKIMAHRPEMVRGFLTFVNAAIGANATLDPELRQMIAHVVSTASGCRYCQAHTAHAAENLGMSTDKIDAVWEYQTSDLFTDAERAALSLAQAAGSVPNDATDDHFDELKKYYTAEEITQIVSVIAVFGFLNRWNDTFATRLEDNPLTFAEAHLSSRGWVVGNHS